MPDSPPIQAEEDPEWCSLTFFVEEHLQETYDDFFFAIKSRDRVYRELEKRVVQQAVVEVAMSHEDEIVDRALAVEDRVTENTSWNQENLYLPRKIRKRFNNRFFDQLKLENDELYDVMKRAQQEAAVLVGMEYEDEVCNRLDEIRDCENTEE